MCLQSLRHLPSLRSLRRRVEVDRVLRHLPVVALQLTRQGPFASREVGRVKHLWHRLLQRQVRRERRADHLADAAERVQVQWHIVLAELSLLLQVVEGGLVRSVSWR